MWASAFLIVSLILFIIAAFWTPSPRVSLGWLGLAFLSLSLLVSSGTLPVS